MASPQKENGFTPIAHELLRAFIKAHLSGQQWEALMVIALDSYGQSRKHSSLSISQIAKVMGVPKQRAGEAIKTLSSRKIVLRPLVTQNRDGYQIERRINKDYDHWGGTEKRDVTQNRDETTIPPRTRARNKLLTSTSNSKKEKQTPPAPSGAVRDLMDLFHMKLTEKLGEKPAVFNASALGRLLKTSLSLHSTENVKERIDNWFLSTDPFIVSNGYSPTLFTSKFPLLKGGPIHAQKSRAFGSGVSVEAAPGKYAKITENG